jgi:hypothetical protein
VGSGADNLGTFHRDALPVIRGNRASAGSNNRFGWLPTPAVADDTWAAVEGPLQPGTRGQPGGELIARLLNRERGARRR